MFATLILGPRYLASSAVMMKALPPQIGPLSAAKLCRIKRRKACRSTFDAQTKSNGPTGVVSAVINKRQPE